MPIYIYFYVTQGVVNCMQKYLILEKIAAKYKKISHFFLSIVSRSNFVFFFHSTCRDERSFVITRDPILNGCQSGSFCCPSNGQHDSQLLDGQSPAVPVCREDCKLNRKVY